MDAIENLLTWAKTQGITINNVGPRALPGRGIGIVATAPIKKGDAVLDVPIPCLKTIRTVPKSISRLFPEDIAVHALLAADIALDTSSSFKTWSAVFPSPQDISSCPLTWPDSLTAHLPAAASSLLSAQREKFESHWTLVSSALPDLTYEAYRYAWLLVNSRTFYHVTPKTAKRSKEDHMILQPVADLLNHSSRGCNVAFDAESFTISADRDYAPGDEIHICYGRHSNDFLLVEYGFVMGDGENEWDEACLDDAILPRLEASHKEQLQDRGFLGNYVADADMVCYRTQVALRTLVLPARRWARFVDGFEDSEVEQGKADEILKELLAAYDNDISSKIEIVNGLSDGEEFQREMLVARWRQVQVLIRTTVQNLKVQ
ncbi:SET domain-containing protein [Colletotrichum truncatum]|uniref:SET domain-containing protein n=1 Tax=Colletotrichum truncatum TaxID=5467 RepID=A0ACC3Z1J4_COLTU|nr:SET domain-containing protein [Colletotrichum truncatum]KAF6788896.1 SET domain-containing protein [Colletotrichum truncatum]